MSHPVRISAVSYLNTIPFLHGLENHDALQNVQISRDIPAECARKLLEGKADVGLVPVAAIPHLNNAQIITDYCIGCDGPVHSVCLYSDVPLDQIETILLDYQSRTSVMLTKLLAKEHWNIAPQFEQTTPGFENRIGGKTAGLVIGDRTFSLSNRHKYMYDLGEHWKQHTGLPFTFACWVAVAPLPTGFEAQFNAACELGLNQIKQAIAATDIAIPEQVDAYKYLTESISYPLSDSKRVAMARFLEFVQAQSMQKA